MLRDQIINVVALLLVAAALLSWASGDALQAAAIGVVLVLNAIVGVATEWQSGRALEALRKEVRTSALVRRGGVPRTIDAAALVVGDVVLLNAGDRVPADLRVLEAAALRTEESALTGESASVIKTVEAVHDDAPVAERTSMLYLGTMIAAGRGVGLVVATGGETELGRIGRLVGAIEAEPTALQRRLEQLGRRLVYLVVAIGAIVTISGWLRGEPLFTMLEVGLSLAVAAVPEALPSVTTFILAFGVLRMARRNAIVRRLSAVETLGSTTVICSDKTGTLTLNEMTVVELRLGDGSAGEGAAARELLGFASLCNEATPAQGDPTEIALVVAAERHGLDVEALRKANPRLSEEPFDAATRRMITRHPGMAVMKGAPSVVVDACGVSAEERERLLGINYEMAGRGLRVLAVAVERLSDGYTFAGFIGMTDPPRPGVIEAVAAARDAGIRVVMLTGDQVDTARAIARQLGIGERVRHASEIESVPADELAAVVETTDAFARVAPEEKYRIVEALQRSGEIVAVTGDGVNDAPALKKADVGVAMGGRGTEVAKEAADIVLADDNFATIVAAIDGGRAIYANIIKFVHMMFSHNLNEVLTIFVALLVGWPLPLLPLQILWLNLATDVFPAFALALEPGSRDAMRRPPRDPKEALFSSSLIALIVAQAAMLACITLAMYAWALRAYGAGPHAHTIALLALIGVQIGHTFNCRSRSRSAFDGLFSNPHIWYASATVLGMQAVLFSSARLMQIVGVVRPQARDLVILGAAVVLPVAIVEVGKWVARRRPAKEAHPAGFTGVRTQTCGTRAQKYSERTE
jgi:Ca2+-transporting ATPase